MAYCITCGSEIPLINLNNPYCLKCSGICSSTNRFSASEQFGMFCHKCGQECYCSETDPMCTDCKNGV